MTTDVESTKALTDSDRQIIDFERDWRGSPAAKAEAITRTLRLSPARYQQRLRTIIQSPEAMKYDPMLVSRLSRIENSRAVIRRERDAAVAAIATERTHQV